MAGILLYLIYIVLGYAIACCILPGKRPMVKYWAGGVIGTVALMWSNIPFSFIFGFTKISHIAGLLLTALLTAVLWFTSRKAREKALILQCTENRGAPKGKAAAFFRNIFGYDFSFDKGERNFLLLMVPFMLFGIICLVNHSFYDVNGIYYTGQCTYGDMNFHLGIITSLKEQGTFPPDYSICPGEQLDYYFLCDSVSSSLYLFGAGLRTAYVFPMIIGFLLVFAGFWIFAKEILKSDKKANLAFILFFLNGGFGTFYFLDNLKNDKSRFTQIFHEFYHTPTNYVNSQGGTTNICWTNSVVDMMLPQRATLFGWMILFFGLFLLYISVFERDSELFERENDKFLAAGIVAGLIPMIQTYSYFTIGLVAIAWIVYTAVKEKFSMKFFRNWLLFGVPALALSLPQLFIWVFGAVDGESFVKIAFNAYNSSDNWLWFWVKNVGIVFLFLLPAFLHADRKMKAFYSAGLTIFVITEFVQFQTFAYDNNKLYLMWYAFSVVLVASYLADIYDRLEGIGGRKVIAVIILILATNAAVLTMGREIYSGFRPQSYELYGRDGVKAAEYINENTPGDSMFLCYNNHNNIVSSLTGRNIFVGSGTFLASHDVGYQERENALRYIFNDPEVFEEYKVKYGFDYVYISSYERANLDNGAFIDDYLASNYELVFAEGEVTIYKLS